MSEEKENKNEIKDLEERLLFRQEIIDAFVVTTENKQLKELQKQIINFLDSIPDNSIGDPKDNPNCSFALLLHLASQVFRILSNKGKKHLLHNLKLDYGVVNVSPKIDTHLAYDEILDALNVLNKKLDWWTKKTQNNKWDEPVSKGREYIDLAIKQLALPLALTEKEEVLSNFVAHYELYIKWAKLAEIEYKKILSDVEQIGNWREQILEKVKNTLNNTRRSLYLGCDCYSRSRTLKDESLEEYTEKEDEYYKAHFQIPELILNNIGLRTTKPISTVALELAAKDFNLHHLKIRQLKNKLTEGRAMLGEKRKKRQKPAQSID